MIYGVSTAPANLTRIAVGRYDASADSLVVTMSYRGTRPDHEFSLDWKQCRPATATHEPEIEVQLLDLDGRDIPMDSYTVTRSFPLADLQCRPAMVTIVTTSKAKYVIAIPALSMAPSS
jgi:hypothetical protein